MKTRLTLLQIANDESFKDCQDLLDEYANKSAVPACCCYGCRVELDGWCEHDNPSIFIAAGMV